MKKFFIIALTILLLVFFTFPVTGFGETQGTGAGSNESPPTTQAPADTTTTTDTTSGSTSTTETTLPADTTTTTTIASDNSTTTTQLPALPAGTTTTTDTTSGSSSTTETTLPAADTTTTTTIASDNSTTTTLPVDTTTTTAPVDTTTTTDTTIATDDMAGSVNIGTSTVLALPTSVVADGIATSTITVTLKDVNSNPVSGKTVTLAKTSGLGTPTITTVSGITDASGVATFTVKSITAGADVFTATDTADTTIITQTATVTFSTPTTETTLPVDTTPPVIVLNDDAIINLKIGDTFTDPGATATDNKDASVTVTTTGTVNPNKAGIYILKYNASDAAGNAAVTVIRIVTVVDLPDTTPPVIVLNGDAIINLKIGDVFTDPGATALDDIDGDITSAIKVLSTVDAAASGSYKVTYNVSDKAGNAAAEVTRTVKVIIKDIIPVVTLNLYSPDPSADNTPSYSGSVLSTKDIVSIEYRVGWVDSIWTAVDSFTVGPNPTFTFTTPFLSDGLAIINVRAADKAGNVSELAIDILTIDTERPAITLIGDNPVIVEVGSTYTDAGATAADNIDGDLTSSITSVSTVDTNIVGSYKVTYNVSDKAGNAAAEVTRIVNVTDLLDTTPPVIVLNGDAIINLKIGDTFTDAGATATDDKDASVTVTTTGTVDTSKAGIYILSYNASDAAGNPATAVIRIVTVTDLPDTTPPVIVLNGDAIINLKIGDTFTDAGATAADNKDASVTVTTTGTVNTNFASSYTISYNASDTAGNAAATVTRTINVTSVATIATDKPDYLPTDYVLVTGSGWLPGETVKLDFHETLIDLFQQTITYYTVADSEGNIRDIQYLIELRHLGASFILTATGLTSGLTAQTTFTDGMINIKFGTNGLPSGNSITISGDCTLSDSTVGTYTKSFLSGSMSSAASTLAGAAFTFSGFPNSVTVSGVTYTKSSTSQSSSFYPTVATNVIATYALAVLVTSITVTGAGDAATVVNGGTLQMSAAVLPSNATDQSVTWSVATLSGGTATINTSGLLSATGVGTVTVTATANDGSGITGTEVITVTAAPALSSTKAITAFSFQGLNPAVTGTVNEGAKTIALTVPNGTTVTALVATFTNSAASSVTVASVAQVSGTTANNFTSPVSYLVTAEDSTTATYTVTVTVAPALDQAAPTATNVIIAGTAQMGQTLTGSYTYSDVNGDLEGISTFKWYRSNDAGGTGKTAIAGAIAIIYTLVGADTDKFISFEVTPVALTGTLLTGAPVESARTAAIAAIKIATAAIAGVTAPVTGATPTSTITDATEYTATITWNGSPVTFAASTTYTATITITPKAGYTLTGVAANFFTLAGATATNAINTGVVSAVFPATAAAPITITAIGSISGTPQVGVVLTAGALTPSGATATYQWQIADTSGGTYGNINGATSNTYTPVALDATRFIKVVATGTGSYTGSITSAPTTAIAVTAIATPAIAGVTAPVTGAAPVTTVTAGTGYTGTVTWAPSPSSTFASATIYTATITLSPTAGYTLTGVTADQFTIAGSTTDTNPADSGVITAVFPATATTIAATAIAGVTAPVTGATPTSTITDTTEYTATITWNTNPVTFASATIYTATITITPKAGYTLTGVTLNQFTVAGVTGTNAINSGVVSAVFPATAAVQDVVIAGTVADAKTTAHSALTTVLGTYTEGNYTPANWTTLTGFKTAGDLAIDAAADTTAVTSAQTTALNGMAAVEIIAEVLAAAKVTAKADVVTALSGYAEEDYTGSNWIILTGFHTSGDLAIDAADDLTAVGTAKDAALNGMAGVATIGTLTDAKAASHNALATTLGTYAQRNYSPASWTTLTGFKTAGDLAIDAATDLAGVDTAKTTALNGMAGVLTIQSISVLGINESGIVQQTVSEGTNIVDALSAAGAFATITGSGGQTVRIEKISSAAVSEGGFSIEGATSYVDLHLDTSEGVEQIQFTILGGAGIAMWWNGSSWIECSNYTTDAAAGNVTITITGSTSPSLSDLTGTVFTVVAAPTIKVAGLTDKGGIVQALGFTGLDPIIPISGGAAIIAGLAMSMSTLRRRRYKNRNDGLEFIENEIG